MTEDTSTHRTLALALLEAEESGCEGETDGCSAQLWRSVITRLEDIEHDALCELVTVLVGAMAMRVGVTPRQFAETLFTQAPTDEEWLEEILPGLDTLRDSA